MSETLSSAPAHTYPTAPLIMDPFDPEKDVPEWLEAFYDVPYRHDLECSCCSWPRTPINNDNERYITYKNDGENRIIPLPCGCNFRRSCILTKLKFSLDDEMTDIKCPSCNTVLLRHWLVARLLNWSGDAEFEATKGDDKCCVVCHEDLENENQVVGAGSDTSLKLPCGHIFHRNCLIKWLRPAPKGGHGNACPTCRAKLFGAYPPIELFLENEDADEDIDEDADEATDEDMDEVANEDNDEDADENTDEDMDEVAHGNNDEDADEDTDKDVDEYADDTDGETEEHDEEEGEENEREEQWEEDPEPDAIQYSSDRMVPGYEDDYENEDEHENGVDEEVEAEHDQEEEEHDRDKYADPSYWHLKYGIPEFIDEHEQLSQRLKVFDDPTQMVYQARREHLERCMLLGNKIRLRNKALGIAPEDDHYVSIFELSVDISEFSVVESDDW